MNEDHMIAAILSAGMLARGQGERPEPADAVRTYEQVLTELLAVNRAHRPPENT